MNTLNEIEQFFAGKKIALAGVSRNEKKFGAALYLELKKQGRNIVPINPNAKEVFSDKCFTSVEELPEDIDSLIIATGKSETDIIIEQAKNKNIKNLWIQQGSQTENSKAISENNFDNLIINKCVFMFAEPVKSIHNFHRKLSKLFGMYPK
jgi:predicted CoA-binding protein